MKLDFSPWLNRHSTTIPIDRLEEYDNALAQEALERIAYLESTRANPTDRGTSVPHKVIARTLAEVQAARARIQQGTYGTCVRCANSIGRRRLNDKPWTPTCHPCSRTTSEQDGR